MADADEGFGDFNFVSPSFTPSLSSHQVNGVEDEWGDFMDNFSQKQDFFGNLPSSINFAQTPDPANPPQSSQNFDLFADFLDNSTKTTESKQNHVESESDSALTAGKKGWEKPQGAIPLSIFGEEEEDSDLNNPSLNDTANLFPAKQSSSPGKNEVKFGQGLPLSGLIVNLYSPGGQIKIENGSNSNLVNADENSDEDDWQFKDATSQDKVGDRKSAVQVEVRSGLSGISVETTADQQLQVNGKQSDSFEGTLHKSGLCNGSLESGDVFTTSDWLSHKSAGFDNGLDFVTGIATQNGSISALLSQANHNTTENVTDSKPSAGNMDGDDNCWDFKDEFSEVTSGISGIPVETARGRTTGQQLEVNGKQLEIFDGASHKPGHSNGGIDSGDIFTTLGWLSHESPGLDNGLGFVTSISTQNGSTSALFSQAANQNITQNGLNSTSGDGKIDADDIFWDFKDGSSVTEDVNYSSGNKEEQKATGFSCAEAEVLAFDREVQGNVKEVGGHQESFPLSFSSNNKLNVDDSLSCEDVSSHKTANDVGNYTNNYGFDPNVSLTNLMSTLYNQAEGTPVDNSVRRLTGGESSSAKMIANVDLVDGEADFDGSSWEFKIASSGTMVEEDELSSIQDAVFFNSNGEPTEGRVVLNSDLVNGESDFNENSWKFSDAFSDNKTEGQSFVSNLSDTDRRFLSESKLKKFVDFYSRLKEESCTVALHHLDSLKIAEKVAVISNENVKNVKALALHEEIQAAYRKLHKDDLITEEVPSEHPSTRNIFTHEFKNDPMFQVLELEYDLSKRISLAENDLNSAIELFEHSILMLKILSVGSVEEQSKYITTWSKLISTCAQELKHGAFIWKESLLKTVHNKILSGPQGQKYFLALAEIFRVVGVLRASMTLYKPWILLNVEDPAVIFTLLEECMSVWSDSGLEAAVQNIPDPVTIECDGTTKTLLESIKTIHDLDAMALQNKVSSTKEPLCQLSGLSHATVPDMKVVVWDGGRYFLSLANLWANRISCDPPKTSSLCFSDNFCQS